MAGQKLAELRTAFGDRHPARRSAENELRTDQAETAAEVRRVVSSLQTEVSAARDREASAKAALDQANAAANQTSIVQSQLAQLENEIAARRTLYQTLLERASQTAPQPDTAVQAPGVHVGVHVGSPAAVPVLPSGPRPKLTGAVGAFAGFALGCFAAFVRNTATRSFKDPAEIAAVARVPLLAVLRGRDRPRRRGLLQRRSAPAFALSEDALGFLRLRLRQQAMQSGTEIRSVVFVPVAGEDTIDLATQFAQAAAHAGERTLLLSTTGSPGTVDAAGYPVADQSGSFPYDAPSWRDRLVRDSASPAKLLLASPGGSEDAPDAKTVARLRSLFREASDDYSLIVAASSRERQASLTNYLVDAANYTVLVGDLRSCRRPAIIRAFEYYRSMNPRLGLVVLTVERTTGWMWRRRSPGFDRRAVLLRT